MISFLTWMSTAVAAPSDIGVACDKETAELLQLTLQQRGVEPILAIGKCLLSLGQIDRAQAMLSEVSAPWQGHALLYQAEGAALVSSTTKPLVSVKHYCKFRSCQEHSRVGCSHSSQILHLYWKTFGGARLIAPTADTNRSKDGYIAPAGG